MIFAPRALLVAAGLVAVAARLLTGPHPIDDAFITFRYARNLAEGLGLVYNPGEWVLGTTAPLWAIVLGAGYRLGATDLAWLATVLSALCDGASAVLLALLARQMGWHPAGAALVGVAWALNPMSIAFASGGMETSLFVLLTLVVLSLSARGVRRARSGLSESVFESRPSESAFELRHLTLAAALASLATLVRPEGALLAAVVVACAWYSIASASTARIGHGSRGHGAVFPVSSGAQASVVDGGCDMRRAAVAGRSDVRGAAVPVESALRGDDLGAGSKEVDLVASGGSEVLGVLVGGGSEPRGAPVGGGSGVRGGVVASAGTWATAVWKSWPVLVAAVAPMGLAGVVLAARYGSLLPNSVAAKQVAYAPAWPLENAVALLMQAGLPGWSTYLLAVLPAASGLLLALSGLVALVELTRRGIKNRHAEWLPFAAFAVLYVGFYIAVGLRGVRLFPWYLVPVEPFYLLTLAAGLRALSADVARLRSWSWPTRSWSWLAPAALVAWQLAAIDWHQPLLPAGEDLAREQLYVSVGHALADSLPPDALVAAPEIGALGYASGLRMLDTVGLVSPAALPYYPLPADELVGDNAVPARLVTDLQPDAVVTLEAFARRSLLTDPTFETEYQLEARYPARVWQSDELLVYRRVAPPTVAKQ